MQKIKNIIRLILSYIYFPLLAPGAKKRIADFLKTEHSVKEHLNWVQNFRYGPSIRGLNINFKPVQINLEITKLLALVAKHDPKIIVEIGTASGGTLFLFSQVARNEAKIISIDLPFGKYGAGYLRTHAQFFKLFTKDKQELHLLRADSHQESTFNALTDILKDSKIDFLFIDGDHTYQGVSSDFIKYQELVRPGGIIAFHDIIKNVYDPSMEVWKFWQEIKTNYEHEEFIEAAEMKSGCGIGVIKTK